MMRPFACDAVIIKENKIVLIKRGKDPFIGEWALPGGRIEDNETAEECLIREAREETGLEVKPLKLVGIYSDPKRDPRGIIAATYLCEMISGKLIGGDDAAEAKWFELSTIPKVASDHEKMIKDAIRMI